MASTTQDRAIARLAPARDRARAEWRLLGARLSTVSPQAVGRGLLAVTVVAVSAGFAAATWPALLPFALGGLLAYAIYPWSTCSTGSCPASSRRRSRWPSGSG